MMQQPRRDHGEYVDRLERQRQQPGKTRGEEEPETRRPSIQQKARMSSQAASTGYAMDEIADI